MTITTEQLEARATALGLDFFIEDRSGIQVKQWFGDAQGCQPATCAEVAMWELLAAREAVPVAYIGVRMLDSLTDGARSCGRVWPSDRDELSGEYRLPLYTAPPAPAVNTKPDFDTWFNSPEAGLRVVNFEIQHKLQLEAWSACRAAMLEHVSQGYKLNSPEIQDGWILVPEDPTEEHIAPFIRHCCDNAGWVRQAWREMLAAAQKAGE